MLYEGELYFVCAVCMPRTCTPYSVLVTGSETANSSLHRISKYANSPSTPLFLDLASAPIGLQGIPNARAARREVSSAVLIPALCAVKDNWQPPPCRTSVLSQQKSSIYFVARARNSSNRLSGRTEHSRGRRRGKNRMSSPPEESPRAKRLKSSKDAPFTLIYWPGLPGRGEHIRLALEEAGADYTDTARVAGGVKQVLAAISGDKGAGGESDDETNLPLCAPPILRHGDLVINQTANILLYLGPRLGLVPPADEDADAVYRVNGLALTALDGLSDEVHNCHHPISSGLYYEDQKAESLRKSRDFVSARLPKFLGYFETVLASKASGAATPWLYGGRLTYADLVLFQCLDGTTHQFPKAVEKMRESGLYERVFSLCDAVRERPNIKAYLASDRRQKYSNGIYRYIEELDVVE